MDIVVIANRTDPLTPEGRAYMINPVLPELCELGHTVTINRGRLDRHVPADFAIMHVDLTVVPAEYLAYGAAYERCLNLPVSDISKRRISGAAIAPGETWEGRVISKPNLNYGGVPEWRQQQFLLEPSKRVAAPARPQLYRIYTSLAEVPDSVLNSPDFVIEKFLPERIGDRYAVRFWSFFGTAERCMRLFARVPIVKADTQVASEPCEVPEALRAKREELGFSFGKFDFVVHGDEVILLDANKTPGAPPVTRTSPWPAEFAAGLIADVKRKGSHR